MRRWVAGSILRQFILGICAVLSVAILRSEPLRDGLAKAFSAWDAHHYLTIAQQGYASTGAESFFIVFFPLYPALIRVLGWIGVPPLAAGFTITTIASILAHFLFHVLLLERGIQSRISRRALLLLWLSPITVYFTMVYTEALFLLWVVLFFLMIGRRRFEWAAMAAFLAALTRNVGVTLAVPYLIEAWKDLRSARAEAQGSEAGAKPVVNRALVHAAGLIVIASGLGVYLWINYRSFGDPFFYQKALKQNWHKEMMNPFRQYVAHLVELGKPHPGFTANRWLDLVATLAFPALLALYLAIAKRRMPFSWIAWSIVQFFIIASQSFWLSSARYILMIFPVYVMLAEIFGRSRIAFAALTIVFGALAAHGIWLFGKCAWLY